MNETPLRGVIIGKFIRLMVPMREIFTDQRSIISYEVSQESLSYLGMNVYELLKDK